MAENRTGIGVALLVAGVLAAFVYQGTTGEEVQPAPGPGDPGTDGPRPANEFIPVVFGDPEFRIIPIQ